MTSPAWLSPLESLAASNSFRLVKPSDADFEALSLCYILRPNDKSAAIVRPKSAEDVSALIKFCTSHSVPFVVRSGGHDSAGRSQIAGVLTIDMREMNQTTVSADRKTAKVAGGALLYQVADALGEHGLITPVGVISTVGYVGWATGAGYGPFVKGFGMGVDQIIAAKLVNWEGNIVDADEELLKGLRGAGPAFGAIVELTIKVYPLDTVLSGFIMYDTSNFETTINQWFDGYNRLSKEEGIPPSFSVQLAVIEIPGLGRIVTSMVVWSSPDQDEGRRWVDKIASMGNCVMQNVQPNKVGDYLRGNDSAIKIGSWGHNNTVSVRAYTPKVSQIIRRHTETLPGGVGFASHFLTGPSLEPSEQSVFGTRVEHIVLEILSATQDETKMEECIAWGKNFRKDFLENALEDVVGAGFPALLTAETSDLRKIYGHKYEELIALKRKYDPHNVFKNTIPNIESS